ncbi:MAG: hypothetical protein R3F43_22685 [bacterium]
MAAGFVTLDEVERRHIPVGLRRRGQNKSDGPHPGHRSQTLHARLARYGHDGG